MPRFCIDQRVRLINNDIDYNAGLRVGSTGTIREVSDGRYGVEWDDLLTGHSLEGRLHNSTSGWYVDESAVELLEEEPDVSQRPCYYCGDMHPESRVVDGRVICGECFPKRTFICSDCGNLHDVRRRMRGTQICRPCFDERYYRCCRCEKIELREAGREVYGSRQLWCSECVAAECDTCEECGVHVRRGRSDTVRIEGRLLCHGCASRLYRRCDYCNCWIKPESATEIYAYGNVALYACPKHRSRYPVCEQCGHHVISHRIDTVVLEDGTVMKMCEDCADEKYPCCYGCETRFHASRIKELGECKYCDDCYSEAKFGFVNCDSAEDTRWYPPSYIDDYGTKPRCIMYPKKDYDDPIYEGIELEVDGGADDRIAKRVNEILGYTYIKHDGSLDEGMEIVTHPAKLSYHIVEKRDAWIEAMRVMRAYGLSSHAAGTCGLHIHVSSAPLEADGNDAIEKLLFIFDKFWDQLVVFSRRDQCQLRWAARSSTEVNDDMPDDEARSSLKSTKGRMKHGGRYRAVNLTNRHTVEFRLFRGTLRPETFFATLQLVDHLVRIAMHKPFSEIRKMSWDDLVNTDYPELNAYLASRRLVTERRNSIEEDNDFDTTLADLPVAA
jgi:hypothetical protein